MAGLTPQGLIIATLTELVEDTAARLRTQYGAGLPVDDSTIEGRFVIIIMEALAKCWEALEQVNSSQDPDKATGASLDATCALTGTLRDPASASAVSLILTGDDATEILAGNQVSTGLTFRIATDEDVDLAAVDAWTAATAYAVGDRVTNATGFTPVQRVYSCITAGTSAGSGGPSTDSDDITDNTVHWTFVGLGAAAADVTGTVTETGPNAIPARSATVIETPLSGWLGAMNLAAGSIGSDVETDEDLRVKRLAELTQPGTGPLPAIRADLLDVVKVTTVKMFQNVTDVTDADGVPPHSVEALVEGGDDQDIYDALLASVDGGIRTHGNTTGTATDDEGTVHTIKFSRPVSVPIYVDITLTYDADEYPADGDDQVAAAIVEFGNARAAGRDAVATALQAQAFVADIGVLKVTACLIDDAPSPATSNDVVITSRQRATYDVANVAVTSSAGTP